MGANTEAGSENCYVKFGAIRSGSQSEVFSDLLNIVESFAFESNLKLIEAGVNLSNPKTYDLLYAKGFRPVFNGIAMQKPNEPGFFRGDAYVLNDWR